jgi:hypothetical protein
MNAVWGWPVPGMAGLEVPGQLPAIRQPAIRPLLLEQQPDSNRQSDRVIQAGMPVSIPRNRGLVGMQD